MDSDTRSKENLKKFQSIEKNLKRLVQKHNFYQDILKSDSSSFKYLRVSNELEKYRIDLGTSLHRLEGLVELSRSTPDQVRNQYLDELKAKRTSRARNFYVNKRKRLFGIISVELLNFDQYCKQILFDEITVTSDDIEASFNLIQNLIPEDRKFYFVQLKDQTKHFITCLEFKQELELIRGNQTFITDFF